MRDRVGGRRVAHRPSVSGCGLGIRRFDATLSNDAGALLPGTRASPRTGLAPAGDPALVVRLHHPSSFLFRRPYLWAHTVSNAWSVVSEQPMIPIPRAENLPAAIAASPTADASACGLQ